MHSNCRENFLNIRFFFFFILLLAVLLPFFHIYRKKSYIEEILLDAISIMLINNKLKLGKI